MGVLWALCGNVTDTSASFSARADSGLVRFAVATTASFTNAAYTASVAPDSGVAKSLIAGLSPDTAYYYAPEVGGVLDTDTIGRFRTDPPLGQPADVTIRAFSCAGDEPDFPGVVGGELAPSRVSNSLGFVDVMSKPAARTIHMGDWTYYNLGSNAFGITGGGSLDNYRREFDDFLSQPHQRQLYLDAPLVLQNDDHEGPNDHDASYDGLPNLRQAFRERVPHEPLTADGTLYREFTIARTRYIVLDSRSGRSPNSMPDGPDKSMLGAAQRFRLQQTLATAREKALVIFAASVWWEPDRADGWASFQTEQRWLIDLINQYGWTGRVAIISGDVHSLGLDSGRNSPGGIPTATLAGIDSEYGQPLNHNSQGPTHPGRRQWGTIRVNDTGDHIAITISGYIQTQLWDSYTFGFDVTDDTPPVETPPPASTATPSRTVDWLACDLVTGDVLAYLPTVGGAISRALGAYTQDSLTVPIPAAGPGATRTFLVEATQTARSMLVCVVNNVPVWGGIIIKPTGGTIATTTYSTVSLEGYLARRYVGDHKWTQRDQTSVIAAGLIADAQTEGIGLVLDCPPSGVLRDREYLDQDDGTVYDRLVELMSVENGPEWTIDLEWADERQQSIAKVFRCYPRIGRAVPGATISTTGAARASYTFSESYAAGEGANHIVATSSGEGTDRPQSRPARADVLLEGGMPRYELRFTPSSSIKDSSTLQSHARSRLSQIANGTTRLDIDARWDAEPVRLALDIALGDQVAFDLRGHMHPLGLTGDARLIGWKLDPSGGTYTPTLVM